MSDDAFAPPSAEGEPKPPVRREPSATGGLDPMDVPRQVWEYATGNPVGLALTGLAYLGSLFGLMFAIGLLFSVAALPGIVLDEEGLIGAGMLFGMLVYIVLLFGYVLVLSPLMNASLTRAVVAELEGGPPVGFTSAFSTLTQDAGKIVLFYFIGQAVVFAGMLCFYVPGLIAAMLVAFAFPMVVIHRTDPLDALRLGFDHMKEQAAWHLVVWLSMILALLVLEFTIVGLLFLLPLTTIWQTIAFRQAFPDAD